MQRLTTTLTAVLLVAVLAGCRSYGGYGSEEALYRQIERANEEFVQDLERIQREQPQLQERLADRPDGDRHASSLGSAIALHESLLEKHRNIIEELGEGSGHRALSRAYGAMITDQEMVRSMYRRTRDVAARPAGPDTTSYTAVPYNVVPAFYYRGDDQREAVREERDDAATPFDTLRGRGPETGVGSLEAAEADTTR